MGLEIEVIPEQRRISLHSDEITVPSDKTIGQVLSAEYPNLVSASPSEGKVFKIVFVLMGREEDI